MKLANEIHGFAVTREERPFRRETLLPSVTNCSFNFAEHFGRRAVALSTRRVSMNPEQRGWVRKMAWKNAVFRG